MRSFIVVLLLVVFAGMQAEAQRYVTKTGHIRFFSTTPVEDIEAHNHQVNAAIDAATGEIAFKLLMRSFQFEKALMQEHFNENYIESHKYPNASFKGKITNINEVDFSKNGQYDVMVEGDLHIKDVTRQLKEKGTLEVNGDKVKGTSTFYIQVADYHIKIPAAVSKNIARSIRVDVNVDLEKMAR